MRKSISVNPRWESLRGFVESLAESYDSQGETIYDERNKIKRFRTPEGVLIVKSYRVPHLINRIVYGNFRKSKARRAYEHGFEILSKGFQTPEPVAFVETKCGVLFGKSYFVSFESRYGRDFREISDFPPTPEKETILRNFARFTADLHESRIFHKDYTPGNIRFGKGEGQEGRENFGFELIDTNRMRFGSVSMDDACRSMRTLCKEDGQYRFLAREYAACRGFDPDECESLMLRRRILNP